MCGFGDQWIKDNRPEADAEAPTSASKNGLIVFVKNPELGKVKTRLAATIGDEAALKAYHRMLRHTREIVRQIPAHRFLFYSAFIDAEDDWSPADFDKGLQVPGDLGKKISEAFQKAFAAGMERVLIVGSDCLDLRIHHLQAAFAALQHHDFVVGPAEDGGYYLLGMRKFTTTLFRDKAWSTDQVLPATLADIAGLGSTVELLETLSDVDYEADWRRSLARLKKEKSST
ncbi:MAG: TIGR04282 family arsenosugar biosynthesis glycosyltransferase [Bacteroidota bacterium]